MGVTKMSYKTKELKIFCTVLLLISIIVISMYFSTSTVKASNITPTLTPTIIPSVTPNPTIAPDDIRNRSRASATIQPLSENTYNKTVNDIMGNGNFDNISPETIVSDTTQPSNDALGPVFWIIVLCIPAVAMLIKTESFMLPGIIIIADGGIFLWLLPFQWQAVAIAFVVIGIALVILSIVIRRR